MKSNYFLILMLSAFLLIGSFFINSCTEEDQEKEIEITELPAMVVSAIQDTLPGIVISEAEIEGIEPEIIYEVDGTLDGKEYEVEVTPAGKILEIEEENDEDADDDDENEEETNDDDGRNTE